ncbi:hypothetical protein CTI14_54585, partial [Methylobacterium radiotolerans]
MNIGFIGLGIMGAPMAGHLIAAGHSLFLKSRRGVPEELARRYIAAGTRFTAVGSDMGLLARNAEALAA